jgi:hypothetical protein
MPAIRESENAMTITNDLRAVYEVDELVLKCAENDYQLAKDRRYAAEVAALASRDAWMRAKYEEKPNKTE